MEREKTVPQIVETEKVVMKDSKETLNTLQNMNDKLSKASYRVAILEAMLASERNKITQRDVMLGELGLPARAFSCAWQEIDGEKKREAQVTAQEWLKKHNVKVQEVPSPADLGSAGDPQEAARLKQRREPFAR